MALRICFVAAETAPFAKAGGLADVAGALGKYLHAGGHDIRLFLPLYRSIRRDYPQLRPVANLQKLAVQLASYRYEFSVSTLELPDAQTPVYLIDCPAC